jgi:hypothetical protein
MRRAVHGLGRLRRAPGNLFGVAWESLARAMRALLYHYDVRSLPRAGNRLQPSLMQTGRVSGKPRNERVASLGSVDADVSVRERLAFWAKLPERLAVGREASQRLP